MSSGGLPAATKSGAGRAAAMTGEVLLHVEGVSQKLGGAQILDQVSFQVKDQIRPGVVTGQVVSLLGPSGVGKTRLLRLIAGLDAVDQGRILGPNARPIERGTVGVVFQNYPLLKHRTVLSNLETAAVANGIAGGAAKAQALNLLGRFGLAHRADYYPAQLSGGQRQRVAIAQQMMRKTSLLLMDEPFSGLDPAALEDVMKLLVEVANMDELNTVIVVTHDVRSAMIVSDTLLMLGRDRTPDGKLIPGARIQKTVDLVALGLAWREDVQHDPRFSPLERELKAEFRRL